MCHALTQEIRTIKTSSKKVLLLVNLSQKTQVSSVECWDHCDEIKTIS